jgi:hypothetical protein
MNKKTKISVIIAAIAIISVSAVLGFFFLPPVFDSIGPVPKFVSQDWIELEYIGNISKYGSTIGHGYPNEVDEVSNKHYFNPFPEYASTNDTIKTFAPAKVRVVKIEWEQHQLGDGTIRGQQIHLRSVDHPSITFVFFHQNVKPTNLSVNMILEPGDWVGYCDCRENSNVDISLFRGSETISWFEVLSDEFIGNYTIRGIPTPVREYMIKNATEISESANAGYDFNNPDPDDWVNLERP